MRYIIENDISQNTIEQVYQIAKDYTRDYFSADFPDNMRVDMRFQRAALLKDGGEIVSCIVFTGLDGSAHITMMATRRSRAGNGYGQLLMRRFAEHVTELGLNSIELYTFSPVTNPNYASTVSFYQKTGFKVISEHKDLWGSGTVTLKMSKSW